MPYQPYQPRQRETILVVDDHDAVRRTMVRGLREDGYRVLEASDGQLALSVLASGFNIDLVVVDIAMPNMGGLELADIVKMIRHPPVLLFITGYHIEASAVPGRLLRKPFAPGELAAEVRRLLAAA